MVISSFISSILVLALGIWAFMRLESSMNQFAERQLLIEPSKFSYKMWKDMPVTMYQSFTFFNLTNWQQVKSIGQKPRFVEVGPYVYRTIWTKSDVNFLDDERQVSFSERKQWIFQAHLSRGHEDDQIWTINTPLMTALALIQNAPVITRNIVSVILDGLGEGAFIKRNIRSLLFEGYSDLIVSVGPLFDRRFANFNGKFAYLYNKNDSTDGQWTVSTGTEDLGQLNKITRFQSNIVNMSSFASGQLPQGLIEVKPECAAAWSLDQATNGQLFAPFNRDLEQAKLEQQLAQLKSRTQRAAGAAPAPEQPAQPPPPPPPASHKRFFSRSSASHEPQTASQTSDTLVANPFASPAVRQAALAGSFASLSMGGIGERASQLRDVGKFIFYPDLCRPIHLLAGKQDVVSENGIKASRYYIDPRVFMNSSQVPANKCYEMNPRPAFANALAATINSVTGANVQMPSLVAGASSPFAMFAPPGGHHNHAHETASGPAAAHPAGGLFERANYPSGSFLNSALHGLGGSTGQSQGAVAGASEQQAGGVNGSPPVSRLGRVRQLFSNIVSQRMSAGNPGGLLPSLASMPANLLMGGHFAGGPSSRQALDESPSLAGRLSALAGVATSDSSRHAHGDPMAQAAAMQAGATSPSIGGPATSHTPPPGGSDRWITQFRFKWPRGVFSIGQCQLGAPIYASQPHFLDADEYYLEQVDGLKPNRSLHEFYIDIESTLHSIPINAKARLQLNVATPELRFRNIPNAMIPVLWQEVTFQIDKPIASMLFWSFTMSPTLYKLVSLLLLAGGSILLVASFVGGFRQHRRHGRQQSERRDSLKGSSSSRSSSTSLPLSTCLSSSSSPPLAHVNHAYSTCADPLTAACPASTMAATGGSPKQPSSRASSHCELVAGFGGATGGCTSCLLACLRHAQAGATIAPGPTLGPHLHCGLAAVVGHHPHHQQPSMVNLHVDACSSATHSTAGDGSLERLGRQHTTSSDTIDKTTLSSRGSSASSSSSRGPTPAYISKPLPKLRKSLGGTTFK